MLLRTTSDDSKKFKLFTFRRYGGRIIETCVKMKNDILCQFSAAVAKLLLRHILFADSVENLRQAKCQIYNIGP